MRNIKAIMICLFVNQAIQIDKKALSKENNSLVLNEELGLLRHLM